MFSRPVSRTGCPGCSHVWNPSLAIRTSPPPGVAARPSYRAAPRRLSSSKASCPPGSGRTGSESATSDAQSSTANEAPDHPSTAKEKRPGSSGKRKVKYSTAGANTLGQESVDSKISNDPFAIAPAVPPTSHLHENDVKLSSFFALHRPMSIHTTIPQPTSSSAFASIFQQPSPSTKWKPADVIYTLNTAVMNLEGSQNPQSLHESVLSQSSSHSRETQHGSQAGISLDEVMKKYRPFNKPPAPIPLDPTYQQPHHKQILKSESAQGEQPRNLTQASQRPQEKKKTFSTTVYISESTDTASGAKTYSASATPIVEQRPTQTRQAARQPFLSRMRARGGAQYNALVERVSSAQSASDVRAVEQAEAEAEANPGNYAGMPHDMNANELGLGSDVSRDMLLISVRRRRKLKMKKHKYKKLMRRTRNIRRREGRT